MDGRADELWEASLLAWERATAITAYASLAVHGARSTRRQVQDRRERWLLSMYSGNSGRERLRLTLLSLSGGAELRTHHHAGVKVKEGREDTPSSNISPPDVIVTPASWSPTLAGRR